MLIVILCQGVLPNRGDHLPWGPTRWQRSGHSGVRRSCARLPFATQTCVRGAASGLRKVMWFDDRRSSGSALTHGLRPSRRVPPAQRGRRRARAVPW